MVRKTTLFRRKLRGFLSVIFFSLLLFIGVFGVCFGVWFVFHQQQHLTSPLVKVDQRNAMGITVKIQMLCDQMHLVCNTITINSDNSATITLENNEQVILSLQKDLTQQFASLQLTIAHLTIEGKRFRRLDFRFDNPVISF